MENVIIQASAGTGKTHQLACRYLLLLFSGVRPENILATTFTKKAAGEILNRILTWLSIAAHDQKGFEALVKNLNSSKEMTQKEDVKPVSITIEKVQETLYDLIKNLNRINVSTLDSYFNQRLQCFSLELELPMDWELIEESVDEIYRQQVISKLLQDKDFSRIVTRFISISDLKRSVYNQMTETVEKLYTLWKEAPAEAWKDLAVPKLKFNDDSFKQLVETAIDLFNNTQTPYTDKELAPIIAELDRLRNENPYKAIPAFLGKGLAQNAWKVRNTPLEGITYKKKTIDNPDLVNCLIDITKYAQAYLFKFKREQSDFYCNSLAQFDKLFVDYKKKQGQLVFDDIPWFLIRMNFSDTDSDSFRMDGSIRHLMLDEFQDTSLVQWRVLEPLAKRASVDKNGSFFCVGDSKQAIYGWRGGESQLLESLKDLLKPSKINSIEMKESRRSGQAIMDAVNNVFLNLGDNPLLLKSGSVPQTIRNSAKQWSDRFPEHESHQAHLPSYVQMCTAPLPEDVTEEGKKGLDSEFLRMTSYEYAAQRIQELHKQTEELGLSIGVLVGKNVVGAAVADCVKKLKLECSLEGKSPLLDSYEVCQILALMKWIDHPGDAYSYYVVSQSALAELIGIKDRWNTSRDDKQRVTVAFEDCEMLNRIRNDLYRDGYGLTVQRWVEALKPEADERSQRRLEKLEELAGKYDPQGSTRTDDFITYINTTRVFDAFNTRIRVMTYHQSKGLEFDIVVLPQLDAPLADVDSSRVVYGRKSKIDKPNSIIRYFESSHRYLLSLAHQKLFTDDEEKLVQESLCNLYVAMTRARQGLYIILPPLKTGDHKTYEDVLLGTLAKGVDRKSKEPGTTYYETGDPNWFEKTKAKESKEENRAVTSPQISADGEPVMPSRGEMLEVGGKFVFKKGSRSVCVPKPASGWTTKAKPSFVKVVTAEVENLESSGSSLSQSSRGTLFHRWLADIKWLEEYSVDDQNLVDLGIGIGLQKESFINLLPTFKALLNHPVVISTLKRLDESWEAYQEKNVAGILNEDKMAYLVSGAIDRLTVHRGPEGKVDKAIILDYKTVHKGSEISDVRARYAGQMDAYRQIVSKMYGISVDSVETTLLVLEGDF